MRARRRFLLPHKKYMIEDGFEGIGLAILPFVLYAALAPWVMRAKIGV